MKKNITIVIVIIAIVAITVYLGLTGIFLHDSQKNRITIPDLQRGKSVAIIVPVTIRAIESFISHTKTGLNAHGITVRVFSAEGDPIRFESTIKAALLQKPDVLVLFGTQLTDTALGQQFNKMLPYVVASALSAPDSIESLRQINVDPPRKLPLAVISDSPKENIYTKSTTVIKEMLRGKMQTVGILYNESELNSKTTASLLESALKQGGLTVQFGALSGAEDVLSVTKALLVRGCKLVVIPHDKYALPKAGAIVKLCQETTTGNPVPVFSLDDGVVRDSGVAASVSVSYAIVGDLTANCCLNILKDQNPALIPVIAIPKASVFVNQTALSKAGCALSPATLSEAVIVDKPESTETK